MTVGKRIKVFADGRSIVDIRWKEVARDGGFQKEAVCNAHVSVETLLVVLMAMAEQIDKDTIEINLIDFVPPPN